MLAINPDECIDCGVCEPECPIGAIVSDTVDVENKEKWLLLNKGFLHYGLILIKKVYAWTQKFEKIKNKFDTFSENHLNKYAKKEN